MRNDLRRIESRRCRTICLPDAADAEKIELGVFAEDGDVEREGVRGYDAVKGVAVFAGKAGGTESDPRIDREKCIADLNERFFEPKLECFGFGEFSISHLRSNLPRRCRRDQYPVGFTCQNL